MFFESINFFNVKGIKPPLLSLYLTLKLLYDFYSYCNVIFFFIGLLYVCTSYVWCTAAPYGYSCMTHLVYEFFRIVHNLFNYTRFVEYAIYVHFNYLSTRVKITEWHKHSFKHIITAVLQILFCRQKPKTIKMILLIILFVNNN